MTKHKQSWAVDHVRKYLEEEFDRNVNGAYVNASSMLNGYHRWCEARSITNRRLTPLMLLDTLEHRFGIRLQNIYLGQSHVHAFNGLRFKDTGLNARLATRYAPSALVVASELRGETPKRERRPSRLIDDE